MDNLESKTNAKELEGYDNLGLQNRTGTWKSVIAPSGVTMLSCTCDLDVSL